MIIELRFGLNGTKPKTQNEIAQMIGISRSYVSRIETKAISKLAKEIKDQHNLFVLVSTKAKRLNYVRNSSLPINKLLFKRKYCVVKTIDRIYGKRI